MSTVFPAQLGQLSEGVIKDLELIMWAKLLGRRFFRNPSPVLTVLEPQCPPGQIDHGSAPSQSWTGPIEPSYRSTGNGRSKTRLRYLPSKIQPVFHLRFPSSATFSVCCVPSSSIYLLSVQLFSKYQVRYCTPRDLLLSVSLLPAHLL